MPSAIARRYRPACLPSAIARRYRPACLPDRTCRRNMVEQIADLMREMAFAGDNVTAESVAQRMSTSAAAVKRHSASAVLLARRKSVRQIGA